MHIPAASFSVNFVAGPGFSLGSAVGLCLEVQQGIHYSPVSGACMCYFGFSSLCSFILDLRRSVVCNKICEKARDLFLG